MKKILIIAFLIVILIAGYFIVDIFLDRQKDLNKADSIVNDESRNVDRPLPDNESVTPLSDSELDTDTAEEQKPVQVTITRENCAAECTSFKNDDLIYCKEVCGLTIPAQGKDSCENIGGIEEDYCWKDLAIAETNFDHCDKIADGNVYETCKNRLTEDIVDQMQLSN